MQGGIACSARFFEVASFPIFSETLDGTTTARNPFAELPSQYTTTETTGSNIEIPADHLDVDAASGTK
jgi:hypothetical protein